MNPNSDSRVMTVLSIVLAASVLLETLLFRLFARGGVYFINDETPSIVKNGYTSLVFTGNTLFNFAALIALLILGLIAMHAWMKRPDPFYIMLSSAVGAVGLIGLSMMLGLSGPFLSVAYYSASSLTLVGVFALVVRGKARLPLKIFVLLMGLSYLVIYLFKGFGLSGPAEVGIGSGSLYALGEWLSVIAFLVMIFLLPNRLDWSTVIIATIGMLLALGMTFGNADSVPLMSTWAFGLTLSLPFIFYAVALWVVIAFVLSAMKNGEVTLATGVLLVMLGHRSIPLTYFNDVVLIGLLFVSMYSRSLDYRLIPAKA
jgi:hypothetical protein|tara:strand:+ start:2251 stop:3195 length:945 start_codon:yes stop_codon:yes gene_type:complete